MYIGGRQPSRVLLQHLDDLLFSESALAQVRLPKERILPKIEDICGEQVRMQQASIGVDQPPSREQFSAGVASLVDCYRINMLRKAQLWLNYGNEDPPCKSEYVT